MNSTIHDETETIPFYEIVFPYVKDYSSINNLNIPNSVKNSLENKLLEELSSYAEVTLQLELDNFVKYGVASFSEFIEKINNSLAKDYPILDEKIKTKVINFSSHISKIVHRFQNDTKNITETFQLNINVKNLKITDIDANLGDGHNGEGTTLVHLSDGTKLIYKPRNVEVTNSYNIFIDWVNDRLNTDLKTFKVLNRIDYGWLEFVKHKEVSSEKELEEYYYKTGMLLATALFLGSKDYHRENIIASGKNPILIDHETIIQPFLENKAVRSWDEEHKIPHFSVLESALIINSGTGVPSDCAGFGVTGQLEIAEADKKVINPNTVYSKRVTRFVTRKLVERNVPLYKGNYVFANQYKVSFKNGFSAAYNLFLKSKEELKSETSPIKLFKDKEVRYVWRPTFVYFKILKYLRNPAFMLSFEAYQSKLYDLLSKAYKGEHMNEYRFILDFEMKQMLNGDIPIFSLGSNENYLEGNTSFKIFERNCLENIYHRIDLLSEEHKQEQLEYIDRWLNI